MDIVVAGTGFTDVIKIINDINEVSSTTKFNLLGFVDDNKNNYERDLCGYRILGGFDWLSENSSVGFVNSIGRNCNIRKESYDYLLKLSTKPINLIHPSVNTDFVKLGEGIVMGAFVHLGTNSTIANNCLILSGSTIGHDCKIGNHCFIGHNAIINGHCEVNDKVFLAAGSVIQPNVEIGRNAIIGPNSFVLNDVTENTKLSTRPASRI